MAGAHEPLPGVLAVEEDAHRGRTLAAVAPPGLPGPCDTFGEIGGGGRGLLPRVAEAHQVGDPPVPEEHAQLPAAGRHAPGAVEREGARAPRRERAQEHPLVGGGPAHALGGQHLEGLGRYGPLGGPHARGRTAEAALVARQRVGDLAPGVVRPGEARGKRHPGQRPGRAVAVAHQREDGMVVRGGGELDLAALGQRPPAGEHAGDHGPLRLEDPGDVGRLVVAAALHERPQLRVVGQRPEPHPGQVEVDLQVAQLADGERGRHLVEVHAGEVPPPLLEQFQVTGHGPDRPIPVDHEEGVEEPAPLLGGEVGRIARRDLEEGVPGPAGHVVLELVEQDRREVHGDPDAGVALQHPGHVGVGAGGVEPHPGQDVGAGGRLPVEGLVHVPQDGQPHRLHGAPFTERGGRGGRGRARPRVRACAGTGARRGRPSRRRAPPRARPASR